MREWVALEAAGASWVALAREARRFVGGHEGHALPRGASLVQRVAWHHEHQRRCGCRPIPAKLLERMRS